MISCNYSMHVDLQQQQQQCWTPYTYVYSQTFGKILSVHLASIGVRILFSFRDFSFGDFILCSSDLPLILIFCLHCQSPSLFYNPTVSVFYFFFAYHRPSSLLLRHFNFSELRRHIALYYFLLSCAMNSDVCLTAKSIILKTIFSISLSLFVSSPFRSSQRGLRQNNLHLNIFRFPFFVIYTHTHV